VTDETYFFAMRKVTYRSGDSRRDLELCAGWTWDLFSNCRASLPKAWNRRAGRDSCQKKWSVPFTSKPG
jgi:hypothetical protein